MNRKKKGNSFMAAGIVDLIVELLLEIKASVSSALDAGYGSVLDRRGGLLWLQMLNK